MLICALTIMINMTSMPWDNYDYKTKMRAEKVCKVSNRCLTKLEKTEGIHYNATCGLPKQ